MFQNNTTLTFHGIKSTKAMKAYYLSARSRTQFSDFFGISTMQVANSKKFFIFRAKDFF